MARSFLIDGYNVMHKMPSLKEKIEFDLEGARNDFIQKLSSFCGGENCSVTIVFDGSTGFSPLETRPGGVNILFSKGPEKADPLIKRIIDRDGGGEQLHVVSSDREIMHYAKLYSCSVVSSSEFIGLLSRPGKIPEEDKPDMSISRNDLDDWLDLFQSKSPPSD